MSTLIYPICLSVSQCYRPIRYINMNGIQTSLHILYVCGVWNVAAHMTELRTDVGNERVCYLMRGHMRQDVKTKSLSGTQHVHKHKVFFVLCW